MQIHVNTCWLLCYHFCLQDSFLLHYQLQQSVGLWTPAIIGLLIALDGKGPCPCRIARANPLPSRSHIETWGHNQSKDIGIVPPGFRETQDASLLTDMDVTCTRCRFVGPGDQWDYHDGWPNPYLAKSTCCNVTWLQRANVIRVQWNIHNSFNIFKAGGVVGSKGWVEVAAAVVADQEWRWWRCRKLRCWCGGGLPFWVWSQGHISCVCIFCET